jgi:adenylosuccinate lyase
MKYRVYVELEWYKRLFEEKIVTQDAEKIKYVQSQTAFLDSIFKEFSEKDG